MYEKFLKRPLDFVLSVTAFILLSPVFLILIITGAIAMQGNPFFVQLRPGQKGKDGQERFFKLIKFRTMSNQKDHNGDLLPDSMRLNKYGKFLRSSSLDELPELINIFLGQLSLVGPRPFLVRDLVFMTDAQRVRHTVRPGLTGLAQVNGRNRITWEQKFVYDLQYAEHITFGGDLKIIFQTISSTLKRKDVVREGTVSDIDLGDWLLMNNRISQSQYDAKQAQAKEYLMAVPLK